MHTLLLEGVLHVDCNYLMLNDHYRQDNNALFLLSPSF